MTGFRVDTKLFQELGQLLVAKESTALVELIKNSYDADATSVKVTGYRLDDPKEGRIVVSDNGTGMSEVEFEKGFLTIAGRTKTTNDRRSRVFRRRYIGEKGVGRLAAHKLGTVLRVVSRKAGDAPSGHQEVAAPISVLEARIDWNIVESLETLDQVDDSGAVDLRSAGLPHAATTGAKAGTTLAIAPLRSAWTGWMSQQFIREAATIVPLPASYKPLPKGLLDEHLLFEEIPLRDTASGDAGFHIVFDGELALGAILLPDVAAAASWIAETDYDRNTGRLRIAVAPTRTMLETNPRAKGFRFQRSLDKNAGPSFQSRILQRSSARWDPQARGVRIYMEGFRVEPYGGPTDDWLGLDSDYVKRAGRRLPSLDRLVGTGVQEGLENEELQMQPNDAYLGAVFLHRTTSDDLKVLVNREGFLSSPSFDFVADWTRTAIDLIVRQGALYRSEPKRRNKQDLARQRQLASRTNVNETPTALRVRETAAKMQNAFATLQDAVERQDYGSAVKVAKELQPDLQDVRNLADRFGSESVQWRVLASLGTELAAFVHEITAIGLLATGLARHLEETALLKDSRSIKAAIRKSRQQALDLSERIRRNATYLVDSTSFEGRRRRSRLEARSRFDTVSEFFRTRIGKKGITLENRIPEELRSPPMFPSELSGILMNLLSNAVKFSDDGGRILVSGEDLDGSFRIRMDNTGDAVDWKNSRDLFDAFQSTTENPDAVLGQGMGMGLTITRAFVEEYGGDVRFLEPRAGFSTAIQFSIPSTRTKP